VRLFACDACGQVLFFENSCCVTCSRAVAYCVEAGELVGLPDPSGDPDAPHSVAVSYGEARNFIRCWNFTEHDACNWLVEADRDQPLCRSCRLNDVIPDLSDEANRNAWVEIERAKRRLLYTLYALGLPVLSKTEHPEAGLAFRFLRSTPGEKVVTGHSEGIITLDIAEADASFRENVREKLGEAYRTVLGHLRHEIGHYYWDRLVRGAAAHEQFRMLFGDERQSYEDSVARHYREGPPTDWSESHVSAYATMHPWEDWAETWAHYMHMVDTLETAKSHGLAVRIPGKQTDSARVSTDQLAFSEFESLSLGWQAVTVALNSVSRSMGVKDLYPFVLSASAQSKLRFVHELIQQSSTSQRRTPTEPASLQR
jgi:hypothetical protein